MDTHAQWEIQEYGRVMAGMLKRVAPLSYEAWIDYDVCGTHVSRAELSALRALVTVDGDGLAAAGGGARLDRAALEGHGLAKREIDELLDQARARARGPRLRARRGERAPGRTLRRTLRRRRPQRGEGSGGMTASVARGRRGPATRSSAGWLRRRRRH